MTAETTAETTATGSETTDPVVMTATVTNDPEKEMTATVANDPGLLAVEKPTTAVVHLRRGAMMREGHQGTMTVEGVMMTAEDLITMIAVGMRTEDRTNGATIRRNVTTTGRLGTQMERVDIVKKDVLVS